MAARIPLPAIHSRPNASVHAYPFQISIQTLEFLQATLLHSSFMDIAAGQVARSPEGMRDVERVYLASIGSKQTYDEAWSYLAKYRVVFEKTALQSVLIALVSHWDWYIRKLGEFILFARTSSGGAILAGDVKRLVRLSSLPLIEQVVTIEAIAEIQLPLTDLERIELNEMSLVRNLGLHNRWEMDSKYLSRTTRCDLQEGDLRVFDRTELHIWHGVLVKLVNGSCLQVAKAFRHAPMYPVAT